MCARPPEHVTVKLDDLLRTLNAESRRKPTNPQNWLNLARAHSYAHLHPGQEVAWVLLEDPTVVYFGGECSCGQMPPIYTARASAVVDPNSEHLRQAIRAFRFLMSLDKNHQRDVDVVYELAWALEKHAETDAAVAMYRRLFDAAPFGIFTGHDLQVAAGQRLLALAPDAAQRQAVALRMRKLVPPEMQADSRPGEVVELNDDGTYLVITARE